MKCRERLLRGALPKTLQTGVFFTNNEFFLSKENVLNSSLFPPSPSESRKTFREQGRTNFNELMGILINLNWAHQQISMIFLKHLGVSERDRWSSIASGDMKHKWSWFKKTSAQRSVQASNASIRRNTGRLLVGWNKLQLPARIV